MKYEIQIKRTFVEYWNTTVDAPNEKAARAKAIRLAKKNRETDNDEFCDGDVTRYRATVYRVTP